MTTFLILYLIVYPIILLFYVLYSEYKIGNSTNLGELLSVIIWLCVPLLNIISLVLILDAVGFFNINIIKGKSK